jgi:hypothetical protein
MLKQRTQKNNRDPLRKDSTRLAQAKTEKAKRKQAEEAHIFLPRYAAMPRHKIQGAIPSSLGPSNKTLETKSGHRR